MAYEMNSFMPNMMRQPFAGFGSGGAPSMANPSQMASSLMGRMQSLPQSMAMQRPMPQMPPHVQSAFNNASQQYPMLSPLFQFMGGGGMQSGIGNLLSRYANQSPQGQPPMRPGY